MMMRTRLTSSAALLVALTLFTVPAQSQTEENTIRETKSVSAEDAPLRSKPLLSAAPNAGKDEAQAAVAREGGQTVAGTTVDFQELLNRPGGLTSDTAAIEAGQYSLDARVAQQDLKSADAQVTKTVYDYAPRLTLTASYTRKSLPDLGSAAGDANFVGTTEAPGPLAADAPLFAVSGDVFNFQGVPNHWYLNAGLVVPISDYLLNMSQAFAGANAAKKTAQLNEQAARVNAAANARLMYYEWVLARLRTSEANQSIIRAKEQLANLRALLASGRVARADVLRQDAFLARAELDMHRASVRENIAQQNLFSIMTGGKGTLPAWEIGEDIFAEREGDKLVSPRMDRLQNEAIVHRLEIQALENTAYALEQKSSVLRSKGYPRLEGFGNLTYANPNQIFFPVTNEWNPSWDFGLRLTWTINDLGATRADAASTQAETAQIRTQKQQIADQLRTEVLTSTRTMMEAHLARNSAHRGLEAAEAAYDDRSLLFQHGRATSLDVLESESALLRARLDLLESYIALRIARVRFDHALGRDVRGDHR